MNLQDHQNLSKFILTMKFYKKALETMVTDGYIWTEFNELLQSEKAWAEVRLSLISNETYEVRC